MIGRALRFFVPASPSSSFHLSPGERARALLQLHPDFVFSLSWTEDRGLGACNEAVPLNLLSVLLPFVFIRIRPSSSPLRPVSHRFPGNSLSSPLPFSISRVPDLRCTVLFFWDYRVFKDIDGYSGMRRSNDHLIPYGMLLRDQISCPSM